MTRIDYDEPASQTLEPNCRPASPLDAERRFHAPFPLGIALPAAGAQLSVNQKVLVRYSITILAGFLFVASGHAQVKNFQVYTIAQAAISHSRPVSFSIGYPNGWTKSDCNRTQPGDFLILDDETVCGFHSPYSRDRDSITIFRASDGTAKEEAEALARHAPQNFSAYSQKRLESIKTKAGDAGYLVAFEGHFDGGDVLLSDFFFHVGAKGAIRVSIITRTEDSSLHESLQKLVLETLHF